MIGLGGAVVALSQMLIFERTILASISWNVPIVLFLFGYIISLMLMYVITAVGV